MLRNFRGLLEAARPQAMATERDMLSLRVAELQEAQATWQPSARRSRFYCLDWAVPINRADRHCHWSPPRCPITNRYGGCALRSEDDAVHNRSAQ
jgi:hypothetical protein